MEYVTLIGAEDVRRAGSAMQTAAENMKRAADQITEAVRDLAHLVARLEEMRRESG